MTVEVNAYCVICKKNVIGKLNKIVALDSGKFLHIGECPNCCSQIKRIAKTKK